jgi:hypothetical protein
MLRVGQDLGIFRLLSKIEAPMSVAQVAEKTSATSELLGQIYVGSERMYIYMKLT